eukprot:scaffold33633_cov19-Tisochrysis_lutea.AAC.1
MPAHWLHLCKAARIDDWCTSEMTPRALPYIYFICHPPVPGRRGQEEGQSAETQCSSGLPNRFLLQATYLRMYHKTLEADITDDTSGVEKKFFLGLIN